MNDKKRMMASVGMLGALAALHRIGKTEPDPMGPVVLKEPPGMKDGKPLPIPGITQEQAKELIEDNDHRPDNKGWVAMSKLDFENEIITRYIIDTRDFHGIISTSDHNFEIPRKVEKHPNRYIHTADEVVVLLMRLFTESGEKRNWRMLTLKDVQRTLNWELKYIHIYRVATGLLVCNKENWTFSKHDLSQPVNQQYLNKRKS